MKSISRPEKILFVALVIYSLIPAFGGLFRILELAGGPALGLPENPRALTAPVIIGLHILSSTFFCIAGAVQFLPSLRRHYASTHRFIGRAVAAAGCLSAATGLWMTHYFNFSAELQGNLLYGVRILLSLSMIGLIAWAVKAIRNRCHYQHSASMLRAYAIGLGASTQTFVGIGWMIFTGIELQGPLRDGLMVFSWAINLLASEWLIHKFLRRTPFPDASRVRSNTLVQR